MKKSLITEYSVKYGEVQGHANLSYVRKHT